MINQSKWLAVFLHCLLIRSLTQQISRQLNLIANNFEEKHGRTKDKMCLKVVLTRFGVNNNILEFCKILYL